MQDDDTIERYIKGQKKKEDIDRIKDSILRVGKKRMAAELIGIPEREIALLYAFHPEKPGWNKIGAQIPLGKKIAPGKQVIEKQEG